MTPLSKVEQASNYLLWSLLDMKRFYIADVVFLTAELGRLVKVLKDMDKDEWRDKEYLDKDLKSLGEDAKTLQRLGLDMSVAHVERMIELFNDGDKAPVRQLDAAALYQELINRISDECKLKYTVVLRPGAQQLLEPEGPLFGAEVQARFPKASFDIDEAAKCIATERGTAAVMHLMRVLEVGLRSLAKAICIDYQPTWDAYIKKINSFLDDSDARGSKSNRNRGEKLRNINGDILATKHAWRNPVMHVEGTYTLEEATTIYRLSRTLMQRLANDLPKVPWKLKP